MIHDDHPIEVKKSPLTGSWRVYQGGRIKRYLATWQEAMDYAETLAAVQRERRDIAVRELVGERFGEAA